LLLQLRLRLRRRKNVKLRLRFKVSIKEFSLACCIVLLKGLYLLNLVENKMAFKDFTGMPVWQKGLKLLLEVYRVTKNFPDAEKFGMTSDMRRAANSILHNIAEGFGRYENKDKSRFYKISRGSSYELISQTIASYELRYLRLNDKNSLVMDTKEIIDELDKIIKSVESR
jgi:four helix bundle protein